MNAAKMTLTATVLAAALGLALGLSAVPAGAKPKCDDPPCGGGGGNVSNPDDFLNVPCGDLFALDDGAGGTGTCSCFFNVNVGGDHRSSAMKISLVDDCETDTMLVLPNFLPSDPSNFPSFFDGCQGDPDVNCPPDDTLVSIDGREFTLTADGTFNGAAVITNSTNRGDIEDITIEVTASNACDEGELESAIIFDREEDDGTPKPILSDFLSQTWLRILGTTVTGGPLCDAIVIRNAPDDARNTIVHNSIVAPEAYTDVGMLFKNLALDPPETNVNIGVGSSMIGRSSDFLGAFSGTAVQFDNVDRGLVTNNIIENELDDGTDVGGTGVLMTGSLGNASEFTIKNNTIKGGVVGIQVGPFTGEPTISGLISKNTIVGDGPNAPLANSVGIVCDDVGPNADIIIRKNNTIVGYVNNDIPTCPAP